MGLPGRLGLLLTGLTVGLLLLFSWVTLAQPTSLSGTAHSSACTPLQVPTISAEYELL